MELLKKITVKALMRNKIEIGKKCLIAGVVNDTFVKQTQYGDTNCLIGDFVGIDCETGEQFSSPNLYLPGNFSDIIIKKLCEGDTKKVEFSIQVTVISSNDSKTGYTFSIQSIDTKESLDFRKKIADKLLESFNLAISHTQ